MIEVETTAGGVGRKRGDVRAFRACCGLDFCSGRGWTLLAAQMLAGVTAGLQEWEG